MLPRDDPPIRQGFPVLWLVTAVHYSCFDHCGVTGSCNIAGRLDLKGGLGFFQFFVRGVSDTSALSLGAMIWDQNATRPGRVSADPKIWVSSRLRIGVATFYHIPSTTSTGNHWHSHYNDYRCKSLIYVQNKYYIYIYVYINNHWYMI